MRREPNPLGRESGRSPWRDPLLLAAAVLAFLQVALVWTPVVPLGVPGEWVWPRIEYEPGDFGALLFGLVAAAPVAVGYVWLARAGDRRIAEASPSQRRLWLGGLALAGFAWLWAAQEAAPRDSHRLGRSALVLYFPAFSGYFTHARREVDFPSYLARYEELMAEGDVLHIGTHPPGLTAFHRGLLSLYERSRWLTDRTLALRPRSVIEAQAALADVSSAEGAPLSRAEFAELWAAAALVQMAAAAAVVPLYLVVARSFGSQAAWRAACLWPLVPALAVFLPKSDALFPLLGLGLLALWDVSLPRSLGRAAAAGAVLWLGLTLSLAMLPVALLVVLLAARAIASAPGEARRETVRSLLAAAAVAGVTFTALTASVWLLFDLELLTVWSWNYRNHAAFYDAYVRSYWKWLVLNPLELSIAFGLPAAAACVTGLVKSMKTVSIAWPLLAVVVLLWISGKNSGEAARLWLFLMPWLLWMGTPVWSDQLGCFRWRAILPLQMAVSLLTAVRVSGFGFDEFLGSVG